MPKKTTLVDLAKQLARFENNIMTTSVALLQQTDVDLVALQDQFDLQRKGNFAYKIEVVGDNVVVTKRSHPAREIVQNFFENTVAENNFRTDIPYVATSCTSISLPDGTIIQADVVICNQFFQLQPTIDRSLLLVLVEVGNDFALLVEKIGKVFANNAISTVWVLNCLTNKSTERILEMYLIEFVHESGPPSANTRSQKHCPSKTWFKTTQVVSCGPTAQEKTIEALLRHVDAHPSCFIGIGSPADQRPQSFRLREPRLISQAEMDMMVELSQEILWRNVPSAEFPGLCRNGMFFNLNNLRRNLRKASCLSEDD